jgi:hypothetical protein
LKKLPAILKDSNDGSRNRRLLDWYVECATQPATRRDGVVGIYSLRGRKRAGTPNDPLTSVQKAKLAAAVLAERPPVKDTSGIVHWLDAYPCPALDRYLLESLRRSHEIGWRDLTRTAVEELPGRLGIELRKSTQKRLDEWGDLLSLVFNDIDRKTEPERYERDKERFHILWGSLSLEIYNQCKDAIENRRAAQSPDDPANTRAPR